MSQCQKQMRLVQQATQTDESANPDTSSQDSDKDSDDHGGIICSGRRLSELSEDDSNSSFGDQSSVTESDSGVFKSSPAVRSEELRDKLMTVERVSDRS